MLLINTQYIHHLLLPTFFQGDVYVYTNKVCINFLLLPTRKSCKNVVDQHTVYTSSVTTNIFLGRVCLYQQSLYIPFCYYQQENPVKMLVVIGSVYTVCW